MGHDHNRVALLEFIDQSLDLQRRVRAERGAGFVHQDHLGLHGDRPGDAQSLLLTTREADPGRVEPVLDLIPEPDPASRGGDALAQVVALAAGQSGSGRDVVEA